MTKYIIRALYITAIALPLSCIDQLDYIVDTEVGQLVIYGLVTDQQDVHRVNVSRTNDFGLPPVGIGGASVSLILESGTRMNYINTDGGIYELYGFKPSEGQSVALEVIIDDKVYQSNFETIPTLVGHDKVSFTFSFEPFRSNAGETVFTVFAETQLPETTDPIFLRWMVEETYYWLQTPLPCTGLCPPPPDPCFIFDIIEPSRLTLFDGSSSTTRETFQVMGKRVADNSFLFPFFASVRQLSVNRETYRYWEKIKIITNNQGSLFDTPPAPVLGNIKNINNPEEVVLGYFEVAKETVSRIYTTREDFPYYMVSPCDFVFGKAANDYPLECRGCENRARGRHWTNRAPEWWTFD
ncbi:MAG TPA: DUF4249 domain-containing protein [Anditalea sp.]|nr:DUF4249 domain-containing protein [Anditalea sp.]